MLFCLVFFSPSYYPYYPLSMIPIKHFYIPPFFAHDFFHISHSFYFYIIAIYFPPADFAFLHFAITWNLLLIFCFDFFLSFLLKMHIFDVCFVFYAFGTFDIFLLVFPCKLNGVLYLNEKITPCICSLK